MCDSGLSALQLVGVSVAATLVGVFVVMAAAWTVVTLRRNHRQPLFTTLFAAGDKDMHGVLAHDEGKGEVAPLHPM